MDNIDGIWRTVGGRKIFIKNGQSLSDAMIKSGKFNNKYKKYYTKKLDSIVMAKYSNKKVKTMYVFDENHYYLIENKDYGNYNIRAVLRIDGNEEYIKALTKEIDKDE